jgi:hypothetical protein
VLWVAFGAFWVLVIGGALGAKRYYDTAAIPRTATLTLEQGIVLFRDTVTSTLINAQDNLALREGDAILVGQGARASLTLFDGSRVRLYSGSEMALGELRKSRFHEGFSRVALRLVKGTARLEVAPPPAQVGQFQVSTPHGSALLTPGSFGFDVSETQTRASSRQGWASVSGRGQVLDLGAGSKVLLGSEAVDGPMSEGDFLVANGDFAQGFGHWHLLQVDEPGRPSEPGERMLATERIDGKDAVSLRSRRVSHMATHNETGLLQVLNKDVSDYVTLQLTADVRVDEQSLSGGGYMGYEYPVMIRVRYRDSTDGQIDWSHGFFHKNPEERPTPNGQEVVQGQWTHYSVDLMNVTEKPVYLLSVEVLGAGHSFDGRIANIQLIGR